MSSTNNPSIHVLKSNTGASKVGTGNGDTVENRLGASDANIAALQGETAQHTADINAHDERLNVLEADSAQHQIDIAANTAAAAQNSADIDTLENDVQNLQSGSGGYFIVQHTKVSANGGSSIVGVQTRLLNTVKKNTINGASLSNNIVTLPAGDYLVRGAAPCYNGNRHRAFLYDLTNNSFLASGKGMYANQATDVENESIFDTVFTLTQQTNIELRHDIGHPKSINGLGTGGNGGYIFSYLAFEKIG